MNSSTLRAVFTGSIALVSVAGGLAYALVAQQQGHSPEPPAWLALLIGGAVTYYYGQNAALNGSAAALTHFAAAVTARRASDPTNTTATVYVPPGDNPTAAPGNPKQNAATNTTPTGG